MDYFIVLIFGLIFGSFINAFVWRINVKTKKINKNKVELSILKGRSMCPDCRHQLSALDLIPLLSWVGLRGKCRYCKKPISYQYPLVELLTALLFLLSYIYWPYKLDFLGYSLFAIWLIIILYFVSLAIYDIKYKLLPNIMVYVANYLILAFVIIQFIFQSFNLSF
ncbi:MAG TPA: prepilin peptidase, partial [Candidatus Saccharimonadia bacterium]|nr:prepilin peptidase [Candidatus Saccharimonadia bacterium]